MKRTAAASIALVTFTALVVAACSAKDAPAAPTTFAITFPSTATAVAADMLTVQAFEVSGSGSPATAACLGYVTMLETSQSLPAPAKTLAFAPCALVTASTSGSGSTPSLALDNGTYAFLVTATSGGTPFLVGCAVESVQGGELLVPIELGLLSSTATVPATTCASLSSKCTKGC